MYSVSYKYYIIYLFSSFFEVFFQFMVFNFETPNKLLVLFMGFRENVKDSILFYRIHYPRIFY